MDIKKIEGYCSTCQSPQRAVVPMEEEEEEEEVHLTTSRGDGGTFEKI